MDPERGYIVFFTNYQSRKARDLEATGRAAALMHWDRLDKQIRIEGRVVRSPAEESDAYFRSRRLLSRIGAWASNQSRPIAQHDELMVRVAETAQRFGVSLEDVLDPKADADIPRPPHWGGYRLVADRVELWLGADGRLHDRAVWARDLPDDLVALKPFGDGDWSATRLQP
jgi:pyridoxamine 5'-phosphate oxidase